ncbi:MAG: TetR family transcriptional regulator [Rhodospirillaceae bacterium]|nr:MAG: TetR family transcriptional regulator [Rhodospirillaceae bacterium]
MVRPREFDTSEALDQALHAFREKGYAATSLRDLIARMGISKSSFYEAFGSKRALFLAVLDRHGERNLEQTKAHLDGDVSPRQAIADFFGMAVDGLLTQEGRHGCLAVNIAIELAAHDPEVAARVNAIFERMASALQQVIARGQAAGEIRADRSSGVLAGYLVSSLSGLRVQGKARPDRAALNDIARITLAALDR